MTELSASELHTILDIIPVYILDATRASARYSAGDRPGDLPLFGALGLRLRREGLRGSTQHAPEDIIFGGLCRFALFGLFCSHLVDLTLATWSSLNIGSGAGDLTRGASLSRPLPILTQESNFSHCLSFFSLFCRPKDTTYGENK